MASQTEQPKTDTLTALIEALHGPDPEMPECIRPINWLKTLLDWCHEPEVQAVINASEDPSALDEMIREVEWLHKHAKSALAATPERRADERRGLV